MSIMKTFWFDQTFNGDFEFLYFHFFFWILSCSMNIFPSFGVNIIVFDHQLQFESIPFTKFAKHCFLGGSRRTAPLTNWVRYWQCHLTRVKRFWHRQNLKIAPQFISPLIEKFQNQSQIEILNRSQRIFLQQWWRSVRRMFHIWRRFLH